MEHGGGYCEKKDVFMCVPGSLCPTVEIDRTLQINSNGKKKNHLKKFKLLFLNQWRADFHFREKYANKRIHKPLVL